MSDKNNIPYKIYLEENEMPDSWYNVRADMKNKPAPLLNPGTQKPLTFEEMRGIFCDELCKQELDDTTPYFKIPDEIRKFTECTVLHRLSEPTVWRKSCRHRQRFIISSKEIIPVEAIS